MHIRVIRTLLVFIELFGSVEAFPLHSIALAFGRFHLEDIMVNRGLFS
jgi:hypothetical protein